MCGAPVGLVAMFLLFFRGIPDSTGAGAAIFIIFPISGLVIGSVLGFTIRLLWHAWFVGYRRLVILVIALPVSVAPVLIFENRIALVLTMLGGAVTVGIVTEKSRAWRMVAGAFAGAVAGAAFWIFLGVWGFLAWALGLWEDVGIMEFRVIDLACCGSVAGFFAGLVVPRRVWANLSRLLGMTVYTTWALILAGFALALPIAGLVILSAGWFFRGAGSIAVSASERGQMIAFWSYAATSGAGLALGALAFVYWAAVRHQEQSGRAPSRRSLAVRLALVALVLNGAPLPWLCRAGRVWQQRGSPVGGGTVAAPSSPLLPTPGASPIGPRATPQAKREGTARFQGAGPPPEP
jgi:hypothetical protein